ncbi:GTP cyclohydrolase 1 type 2/Nif3 [Pholiota molesta]|nr:GTP cyclohydrolase 1 type 2/Nif3 [Pholiota molesta]
MSLSRFKLVFFVPKENTRRVLDHLFGKFPNELGKIGDYEQCAFITRGTGQFMPKQSANPTIGKIGQLEFVEEDRVELVINDKGKHEELKCAITELKNVHPYEEVAYDVYKVENF